MSRWLRSRRRSYRAYQGLAEGTTRLPGRSSPDRRRSVLTAAPASGLLDAVDLSARRPRGQPRSRARARRRPAWFGRRDFSVATPSRTCPGRLWIAPTRSRSSGRTSSSTTQARASRGSLQGAAEVPAKANRLAHTGALIADEGTFAKPISAGEPHINRGGMTRHSDLGREHASSRFCLDASARRFSLRARRSRPTPGVSSRLPGRRRRPPGHCWKLRARWRPRRGGPGACRGPPAWLLQPPRRRSRDDL